MKVGIVGGTGNISTAVVRLLLERGHDVTCITRGRTGTVPAGARSLTGDRNDRDWFVSAVRAEKFDAAIDFFAFTPEHGAASLDAFRGVGHLIHTSTVVTVGDQFDWLPVTEDHPVRPAMPYGRNKAEIDRLYQAAYFDDGYPVTVIKPSTTYGRQRVLRQIGIDTRWIRRIQQGRPILRVGDGIALHHLLHVDDAAPAFVGALERTSTIGQVYFLVNPTHTSWNNVHETAMRVLGNEVEQVGVTADVLYGLDPERFRMVQGIFSHNLLYSAAKIQRDVPEFAPRISLEDGLADAFEHLQVSGLVEESPLGDWEDQIIAAQRT
ncbi:MAG TPA: NAD-dependent epimerase/dehydratase family protein, partial [Microbacterium sp.]|uniref:NAD-dependent epimerase/dehydratase family protein n=1 Tax=Microbacterium sp. TaxID=51671 RepID=UPI002BDECDFD